MSEDNSNDTKIIFYPCKFGTVSWTIFWRKSNNTLGVTDGEAKLYEKSVTIDEARMIAGNWATDNVMDIWREMFKRQIFELLESNIHENEVLLNIFTDAKAVTLHRNQVIGGMTAVFNDMVDEYMAVSKVNVEFKLEEMTDTYKAIAAKRKFSRPLISPTHRVRELPTGLRFDDEKNDVDPPRKFKKDN